MVFSSLNFLCLFLPLTLLAHALVPERWKNPVLLAASLFFYAWGEPVYIFLMLLSVAFNYVSGLQLGRMRPGAARRGALIITVAVNLALLGFYKYFGWLVDTVSALTGMALSKPSLSLPIGISFYTFQALSYIIDVYRGDARPQTSPVNFALYITMFPQLVAGPIVKYTDIEAQLFHRRASLTQMGQGVERLIRGLAKKVLLANSLGMLYDAVCADASRSVMTAWLGAIAYSLQIYFDFSGYSDMAIGMGRMLGFAFPENFDFPYMASSVTEFWRRWHISLSSWFRDYVYIPLGGSRVKPARHILNLLAVWMLTGLWHGASWNFVLWGAYYGAWLIVEKYIMKVAPDRAGSGLSRVRTLLTVLVGWVIFSNTNFAAMGAYLGNMIGIGAKGLADRAFLYYLRQNLALLAAAVLCCGPWVKDWLMKLSGRQPIPAAAVHVALLIVSLAFLVYGSYNPFLYFRF